RLLLHQRGSGALGQPTSRKRGYAPVVAGLQLRQPRRLPAGTFAGPGLWQGVHYRTRMLELDWAAAKVYRSDPAFDPTARLERQQFYGIGVHVPIHALGVGTRYAGVKGVLLQPFVAGQVGLWSLGKAYKSGWQVGAAPGVSLQLPFVVIDARVQAAYCFGASEKYGNLVHYRGLQLLPTLALQFDGLWEVFGAQREGSTTNVEGSYVTQTVHTPVSRTSETNTHFDGSSTTRTTTTYAVSTQSTYYAPFSYTMYTTTTDPWWGLGPRVQWAPARDYRGTTLTGGLQFGVRPGKVAFDVLAEYGQLGLASSLDTLPTQARPTPKKLRIDRTDDQFSGTRSGTARILGRAGVDVMGFLQGLEKEEALYFRLILGAGAGYALPGRRVVYKYADQAQWLDAKLADGNPQQFVRNRFSDARRARADWAFQLYTQVEAGPVSLSLERNRYFGDPLADGYTVALGWLLPLYRLHHNRLQAAE
ncbi:MAG: hypothetical protein H7330_10420, partial [Hymenobacteraceae bacterium]|nr:hypothetical protein [Hymenobacteraceae bacterium]